jgi:UDP-glucose:glycoprotein glucosyltransferase
MLWGLSGAVLATIYLHALRAGASPAINIALKTSFDSAPYLLELLYELSSSQ